MINVENLTRYYDDFCAVDNINFEIKKGEILGLLGPNGAGKTTTLRMLTGFLRPSSGNISVKDFNIQKDLLEIKKLIGYLPESAPLYYDMIVYDYLDFIANIRGIESNKVKERIRKLANLCAITAVMHKSIGELSKGYKQRVGLAHAMMSDPEVLVLDEPTSGLDPNQIIEIREIIKEIGKQKTVILSTHILSEVEATCDRVVIINQGKIVADGNTETLKQAGGKQHFLNISIAGVAFDEVKGLFKSFNEISEISLINHDQNILNVKVKCISEKDIRPDIYKKIKETDWILLDFHRETESLENIFRDLTKEN
ncbi:MAG: ATP-binding cassette domain-containing protein [Desulfobacterales bacterium]|nr:ATP-binding cassette domain-containing protein [Desulfobacterales bacterium]